MEVHLDLGKVVCKPGPCGVTNVVSPGEWGCYSYARFMKALG